jgi:hypothetical protein
MLSNVKNIAKTNILNHVIGGSFICGPERMLGPSIYTAAMTIGGSDCPYDLLAEWLNALM